MPTHTTPKSPLRNPNPPSTTPTPPPQPSPDGTYQAPIYRKVVGALENHINKTPGAHVNGNVFIYYAEGNPRKTIAPTAT